MECAFQQKTLPSPSEEKYTRTHVHGELPEAKASTETLDSAHLPGADGEADEHVLHSVGNELLPKAT